MPTPSSELLYRCLDRERFLYHYTSSATAIDHILPRRRLKVGAYVRTNDPKESKEWHFNTNASNDALFERYPHRAVATKMNEGLKHGTNVVCFSQDGKLTGNHITDIYHRGFCRPRMWAQYGDNHRGVCLIFERDKLEVAIRNAFPKPRLVALGPVSYRDRGLLPDLRDLTYLVVLDLVDKWGWKQYIRQHLLETYPRLYFEKNADWSQEREYRWVVFDGDGSDLFVDYGDALRGVMFGASTPESAIRAIVTPLVGRQMFFQQLEWKGCAPWYALGRDLEWEATKRQPLGRFVTRLFRGLRNRIDHALNNMKW